MQRTLKSFFGKVPRQPEPHEPVDGSQVVESVPQDLGKIQDLNNLPDVDLTEDVFHDSPQELATHEWQEGGVESRLPRVQLSGCH